MDPQSASGLEHPRLTCPARPRVIDEAITVLADQAPGLHDALRRA